MIYTFFLYVLIIVLTTVLAKLSQPSNKKSKTFVFGFFAVSFLIHFVFMCFTNIGTDYLSYSLIIDGLNWSSFSHDGTELLFNFLCIVLKTIFSKADIVIFFIKALTIIIYYLSFYLFRNKIKMWLSILSFNCLIFFQFYLIAMNLAIALLLLSVALLMKKKTLVSIIVLVASALVHSTSFLFIPAFIMFFIFFFKRKIHLSTFLIIFAFYLVAFRFYEQLYSYLIYNFDFFYQYRFYNVSPYSSGSGLFQYFVFLFVFFLVFVFYHSKKSEHICSIFLVFSVNAFFFSLLGYKMEVFSRINSSSFFIYSLIIPFLFFDKKNQKYTVSISFLDKRVSLKSVSEFLWVTYLVLSGYLLMKGIFSENSTNDMAFYRMFWPF